jgi:hypothetical protein
LVQQLRDAVQCKEQQLLAVGDRLKTFELQAQQHSSRVEELHAAVGSLQELVNATYVQHTQSLQVTHAQLLQERTFSAELSQRLQRVEAFLSSCSEGISELLSQRLCSTLRSAATGDVHDNVNTYSSSGSSSISDAYTSNSGSGSSTEMYSSSNIDSCISGNGTSSSSSTATSGLAL